MMDCPRCGTLQAEDRDECYSCGIVFARWQAIQERSSHEEPVFRPPPPVEPVEEVVRIPRWAAVTVLAIFVTAGIAWTIWRRTERTSADPTWRYTAKMNEINNASYAKRNAGQSKVARESDDAIAWHRAVRAGQNAGPVGFPREHAKTLLHQCRGFNNVEWVRLPREHHVLLTAQAMKEYPSLEPALRAGLLQRGGDAQTVRYTLWLGHRQSWRVRETPDHYEIGLGRPRVAEVESVDGDQQNAVVHFRWQFERQAVWLALRPSSFDGGEAQFRHASGRWQPVMATLYGHANGLSVCP